ncbi:MAG: DNA polymerase III subunit beta [Elusimicrobiota bacterium]
MKLKLKTHDFLDLLTTVIPAVSERSTLPILSHFLIEAQDNIVKVYANDLEIGIESSMNTIVDKAGSATIPAKNLVNIVKVIDSKECNFKKINNNQFELSTENGNTTFNINGREKEEFPVLPGLKEEKTIVLKAKDLIEGINKTIFSVSRDESRYVLCGIYMEVISGDFKMVSTDGRRLSFYNKKIENNKDNISAIIPTKAINVLDRAITDENADIKISISAKENQIYFSFGNTVIYSRLIEGDYPNYSQVIPDKPTKSIIVKTEDILNATRKMIAVTSERSLAVKCKFKNDSAIISTGPTEVGSGTSTIPVQYKGEEIEISFNPEFIINSLKVIKSEHVKLGLSTPINPCKITPVSDEENYIGVIMPMR